MSSGCNVHVPTDFRDAFLHAGNAYTDLGLTRRLALGPISTRHSRALVRHLKRQNAVFT